MHNPVLYSNNLEYLYPPPGSFKYTTPKPIRNGTPYPHLSGEDDDDEINCDQLALCFQWFLALPLLRLKFWRIVILIILVVTTGHFSTVIMFPQITEPLFVIKYDSSNKGIANIVHKVSTESRDHQYHSAYRNSNNLLPPWNSNEQPQDAAYNMQRKLHLKAFTNATQRVRGKAHISSNVSEESFKTKLNQTSLSKAKNTSVKSPKGHKTSLSSPPIMGSRERQANLNFPLHTGNSNLKLCPPIPPNLEGPVKAKLTGIPSLEVMEQSHSELQADGRFRPSECQARHKVAIIIPFRDRASHLALFLYNIHPFLQKQQIDYVIYIVEQAGGGKFNRAMLMNVGSIEALKLYPYDCFIFHDVDLIPEDDRNLYTCPVQPRHMSVAINTMKYKLPYNDIFGGVSAMTVSQFKTVNGFSNNFWGWGGEDDDMSNRIKFHGFYISRYPANVARYTMMEHKKDHPNPQRYKYLNEGKKRYANDGLNSVKYRMLDIQFRKLFTWFYVELLKS